MKLRLLRTLLFLFGLGLSLASFAATSLDCVPSAKELAVVAEGARAKQSVALECALNGEAAIHVAGELTSSLVLARGYVDIAFADAFGKRLWTARRGPWLGTFSSFALDESVAVPSGAKRLIIVAGVESKKKEGSGRWGISNLRVSPGSVIVGEAVNGAVITADSTSRWRFSSVPAIAGAFSLELKDHRGKVSVSRRVSSKGGERVDVDLGRLPVGYYDVSVKLESAAGLAAKWSSSLVVLPSGAVPNEPRFGMDAALSWYGGGLEEIKQSLAMMRLAGIGSVRDRMLWGKVQPSRSQSDWSSYLPVAKAVAEKGMESVQVFHDSPAWSRLGGGATSTGDRLPPMDDAAAFTFGRSFALGLGQFVRSVEYWNEQNSDFFLGYPYHYASGFKAFSAGVKSVDPGIRVLIGAAAGQPGKFFEEIYKNDVAAFMDARNQHYYGKQAEIEDFQKTHLLGLERDAGLSEVPGWLTEMGYSLRRDAQGAWRKAEIEQAAYLVKTYAGGFAAGYERVFYFFWRELVEAELHTWGVFHEDHSPRPAYLALAMLTRHLAGANVAATERSGNGRSVYFRKPHGEYVAVVWGDGVSLARLGAGIEVRDIFGGAHSASEAEVSATTPVLVSGIKALPAGVTAVNLPGRGMRGPAPLRISANVTVDGKSQRSPGVNRSVISVPDDVPIELTGLIFGRDGVTPSLECLAGRGVEITSLPKQTLPSLNANGVSFSCRFKASLIAVGQSHIGVKVTDGTASDRATIAVVPDVASSGSLKARSLTSAAGCPKWVARHSNNQEMAIRLSSNSNAGCPPVEVTTKILKRGESWAFAAAQVGEVDLRSFAGIRLQVSDALPAAPVPRPLMAQLVEKSGGVWMIDLRPGTDRKELSGLFNLAHAAPWGRDDNGRLDLNNVREVMIGWGGYGGEAGQQHGFQIEELSWLQPRN